MQKTLKIGLMLAAAALLTAASANAITLPVTGSTWKPPVPSAYAYCDLNSAASGAYSPSGALAFATGSIWGGTTSGAYGGSAPTTYANSVSTFPFGVSQAEGHTVGAAASCLIYGYVCVGSCPPPRMPNTSIVSALKGTKFQLVTGQNPLQPTASYKGLLYKAASTGAVWFVGTRSVGDSTQAFAIGPNANNALVFDNDDVLLPGQAAPQDLQRVSSDPFQVNFGYDAATQSTTGSLDLDFADAPQA
ncbi:MAG: hypothetical protein QOI63_1335 [Thermoplasmata archaeon]|jgi:hypothetical protein|nr:hypothetical protein [Thermoplasmata archaeon]